MITMKKLILSICLIWNGFVYSQYSGYYNINTNSNLKVDATINQNVTGSVFEYKTIRTIDYGALQLANAQREKNKIEQQKFENDQQREIALQIVTNPIKAYDYGNWNTISSKDKSWKQSTESKEALNNIKKNYGFKEFRIDYVVPNYQIFTILNVYQLQNVSSEGVKTDVSIYLPIYNKDTTKFDFESEFQKKIIGTEIEQFDDQNIKGKFFLHKKELNRATVYGYNGYRSTLILEDKFENIITDTYFINVENFGNGFKLGFKIRYYGNKSELDFEKLEGRRFYLRPLIEKLISTARVSELEISKK